jgi:type II secretion system protein G
MNGQRHRRGFTLIELLVVMAIIGLLASIAVPRYVDGVDRAREAALKSSLATVRDAIDQYAADRGRYPDTLQDLVRGRYLREQPEDPLTRRRDSWVMVVPPRDSAIPGRVFDVRSGAAGRARDGRLYADL